MRKLPWLAALERLERKHGYDCDGCLSQNTPEQRRALKCGWLPRSQWLHLPHSSWGACGGSYDVPEYCPGYTARLPMVQEIARLWGWEKRGSLAIHLRGRDYEPTPLQLDMLDVFAGECAQAEAWEIKQRNEKQGR